MWLTGTVTDEQLRSARTAVVAALKVCENTPYYHWAYPALADLRHAEETTDPDERKRLAEAAEGAIRLALGELSRVEGRS